MTSVDSSPWRKFYSSLALAAALGLAACAADQKTYSGKERHSQRSALSGKFEWGVQDFEAGKYQEALDTFHRLRKSGSAPSRMNCRAASASA